MISTLFIITDNCDLFVNRIEYLQFIHDFLSKILYNKRQ